MDHLIVSEGLEDARLARYFNFHALPCELFTFNTYVFLRA